MPKYVVGGVTKFYGRQQIPNNGNYTASSKLSYKKMTYGIMLTGGYRRNHSTDTPGEDEYNGIYYNDKFYEQITRSYNGHQWRRSENMSVGFNARYLANRMRLTHNASLGWNQNPGSGSFNTDKWSDNLFDSQWSRSMSNSKFISPQISGDYVFGLSPKLGLFTKWNYNYAHSSNSSEFQMDNSELINNSTEEDMHNGALALSLSYIPSDKTALMLNVGTDMNWYATQYSGTANTLQRQWRGNTDANLSFYWHVNDNMLFTATPGITATYWHLHGSKRHAQVTPTGSLYFNWAPNRKLSLTAHMQYLKIAPAANESGNVIIRQNDLMWLAGNPSQKSSATWSPSLQITWLPCNPLSLSLSTDYSRSINNVSSIYTANSPEMGGVLRTFTNTAPSDHFGLDVFINARLLNNRLNILLQPTWRYIKYHGYYAGDNNFFRMRGSASYNVGNFDLGITYGGAEKMLTDNGMTRSWHADEWSAHASYGNGNLYINLAIDNIFRNKDNRWSKMTSGVYNNAIYTTNIGRSVNITLAYTFGYGKRVDPNIEVYGPKSIQSGSLINE